ncbi:MAG: hypothetical protein H0T56_08320 [Pseudaminobacter sp.]|nr:hypothetical protein [Pseudaminobacter sp.]
MTPADRSGETLSGVVAIAVVLVVVFLNIFNAVILKYAAIAAHAHFIIVGSFILLVLLINVGRVIVWGWIHKRYSLARSYPLTAIFFPLIAITSWWQGEPITLQAVIGVVTITAGVVWYALFVPEGQP